MKNLLTLLMSIVFYSSGYAQVATLETYNPAPRLGDEINVKYRIKWDTAGIEGIITLERLKEINKSPSVEGEFKLRNYTTDTGDVVIGPFSFIVDGNSYKTDSLIINVHPKLPNELSGFWVRYVKYRGTHYLITEQRISGQWVTERTSPNSISSSFQTGGAEFAEILEDQFSGKDIKIDFSFSTSNTQSVEIDGDGNTETANYKLFVYRIKMDDSYQNDFVLDKTHFNNFPENTKFEPIEIKRSN